MRKGAWLALWLLTGSLAWRAVLADVQGRRVGEVLDELRAQGLTFIYSTQLVPASLRVGAVTKARSGLDLATEILSAHGLGLVRAAPGVYAVVSGAPATAVKPAHEAAPPFNVTTPDQEIIVQSSRYTLATEINSSRQSVTQEQVKNIPRLADETLRSLQRLPGTAINGFSSLGAIRGGAPNETAIVVDGLRLYEPFHLKNFLTPVSLLDSRLIDGIEFYSGGFPAPFGDRMSAIVDASTVRPGQPRYYELGLNLFHTTALASREFADERGHILLSGRRGNAGDLARFSENYFGRPHYSDGFARLEYQLDDATQLSIQVLASKDEITALKSEGMQRAVAEYRNVYGWTTLQHRWSDRASTRLIASYTDLANDRLGRVDEPGRRTGSVLDDRLFHVAGLKLDTEVQAVAVDFRFGAEAHRLWGRYDYSLDLDLAPDFPFPGSPGLTLTRTLAPRPEGYEFAAYADARIGLGSRWTLQPGLRVDQQTYEGSAGGQRHGAHWSPRLAALYDLAPRTRLRASWGRYFQPQGVNELQVEDGIDAFHGAPHADHTIVSLDHEFERGIDARIELYRKRYARQYRRHENLFDPLVLFPEAEFDRVGIDGQDGRAEGVELFLRFKQRGSWSGWFGYTWSRAWDDVDGRRTLRSWDQEHAVNWGIVWSRGPWTATVAHIYHTGWPSSRLVLEQDTAGVPRLVTTERNRDRLDFYSTFDLRLSRIFVLPRGALDVFVEATNALTRLNPCCVQYSVTRGVDGDLLYSRSVDSWLPLVPSAGILWRY